MGLTNHLDLEEGLIAVIEQITSLAAIDSNDTEQKLTAQSQSHGSLVWGNYGIYTVGKIGLKNMMLGELAL